MDFREEILRIVKVKGPIIPNQIKKEVGGDTFLIGAILSELVKEGLLKISHTKIGGSPTYYVSGQELKLLELTKYLNEKDRKTLEILRDHKVLRDKDQELLTRVSLRNIRDFARQLEVNIKGEKEIFWKWYLTPREQAAVLIKNRISTIKPEPRKIEDEKVVSKTREEKEELPVEKQRILAEKEKKKPDDDFSKRLHEYFSEKQIEVINETVIRKNSEIELEVKIPSNVGKVEYFCKAKNKKRCNDGDLSSAYLKGQQLKLQTLFITTGEVTKKAEAMLEKEFKGMVLKRI